MSSQKIDDGVCFLCNSPATCQGREFESIRAWICDNCLSSQAAGFQDILDDLYALEEMHQRHCYYEKHYNNKEKPVYQKDFILIQKGA